MSVSSIESPPPIEQTDIRCSTPHIDQFLAGGRLITREMPCKCKTCPVCGPRLARELAAQWAHAMASDQVYRLVVDNGEPAKLRRRASMRGKELAHTPLPDGRRAVYSNAPIGDLVDPLAALTSDFLADPHDGRWRRSKLSDGWAQVAKDAQVEREAAREPWEWLGRVGRDLAQVAMVAGELGILVGRTADMVVAAAPPDMATLVRYLKLIKCRGPWEQWGDQRGRVAA